MHIRLFLAAALACRAALAAEPQPKIPAGLATLSHEQMVSLLKLIDDRIQSPGDYRQLVYLEQKERNKTDTAFEVFVYRRDVDEKLLILFNKPKSEEGKGYLRLEKTLWNYDPTVGKWERRTDRERINGTDSRREDFDQSHLARDYDPTFLGVEKLGVFDVYKVKISVKSGVDVAYPVSELWVDQKTLNILKRQEFALSGKLMRTEYYPKYQKVYSEKKKGDVWWAQEIRIFDEIEKGNSTLVKILGVELKALDPNIFTKAWVESKSR